ncbi:saccharopine dehydrogenase NADP-binding domain-containing protein [Niveibacterium sp. 24ML]|uniref:saccharopine dehydrogenase family protein n=1 Tax=Niveibacterium sp. 24ML TaxID=2985512 RepID=UPI00226FE5A4|nr:saccharopine dehydrogenase NADP-binding domain-containing protein [Niveibacterium sp. 24ML]MCX9156364.1 saccharopine dehydrogenase NADP-binding domain-containing protein [Niveibacterium sp. 24ML]
MYPILILGAGKIGASIAKLLHQSGDYRVTVADKDPAALARLEKQLRVATREIDLSEAEQLRLALDGQRAVFSACSFDVNPAIAQAALDAGVSYFDLTEDVETTRKVREYSAQARDGQIFMPQCGLAPGFIGILAHAMSRRFDRLDSIKMRVGALPQYPHNHMKYNLTWSTDGVINEYCNPCEVIHKGRQLEVLALEGLERFSLDGLEYEAFNTSGGLGTLCETLAGRINDLNYKTVRYPGHQYLMDFLINGLKMGHTTERRHQLREIMESALPITKQDVVLVYCAVSGWKDGHYWQETDARKIYHQNLFGEAWSSIQLTTAAGACAAVDLHREGRLPNKGFVRQESVDLEHFLANRFGRYYSTESHHAERVTL